MNQQPREKYANSDNGQSLDVHSIFHTIQGEGPFTGTACVFVRLAGCNLQCPGCDTDYTSTRKRMTPEDIYNEIIKYQLKGLVVITGGEPFRQNLSVLFETLINSGYYVQVESNGSLPPSDSLFYSIRPSKFPGGVYVVCSPKTGIVNEKLLHIACALKYVLHHESVDPEDGLPIQVLQHSVREKVARPPKHWDRPIYLQPMDCKDEQINQRNIDAVVKSCIQYGYTLQLQIHKIIGVE